MVDLKHTSPFTIFPSKNLGANKHQIVVSKKVSKKAVERNLIKRRIKSIIQTASSQTPLVIVCRPSTLELNFHELKTALLSHLARLNR